MVLFGSGEKSVIYRLDIIFSIAHVAQLMVSKWTSFARELLVDIRRGISEEGYQTSKHVRKLKNDNGWLIICDTWPGCLEKLQFILTEPRQISNLRNQDVSKEILSDLVRKDIAEFSDKCSYFQYAILEMFKLALNNCSVLKLCFLINTLTFTCIVKTSPISIMQLIRTPNHIFYRRIAPK